MENKPIAKTVELKTRHFGFLAMAAGMSFSEWYSVILDTLSMLSVQAGNVVSGIVGLF